MPFFAVRCATVGLVAVGIASPRVMVWPNDGGSEPGDAQAVRAAGFEAVDFEAHRAVLARERAAAREQARGDLEAVRASLEQAQALYLEQDYARMDQVLADAETHLPLLAVAEGCDTLWELEFRRGLAALGGENLEAAKARFRLATSVRPKRRPDPSFYGPDVTQAFLEAVEAERAAVRAPVGLSVTPGDATRLVDCAEVDAAEVSASIGLHVVWAAAVGRVPQAEVVDLAEAASVRIDLAPDPRRGAAAIAALPAEVPVRIEEPSSRAVIGEVMADHDVDAVVWLRRDGHEWTARLHVADGRGKRHTDAARSDAVAAALVELGDDGRLRIVPPHVAQPGSAPTDPAPAKRPVARTWWFWTIVGTAALTAVAVGLGVGLRPTGSGVPSRRTIIVE